MVYIDDCVWTKGKNGRETYAHLVADSYDELHEFATKLGVGRHFFHKSSKYHHYDISSKFYEKAIDLGAEKVHSSTILKMSRKMMYGI